MLAGFGELDDAFGGQGDDRIIIARKFQRSACHLERDLDYAREIGSELLSFRNGVIGIARSSATGGSAIVSQPPVPGLRAAAGDVRQYSSPLEFRPVNIGQEQTTVD
jgi:hypothetical protein